MSAERSAGACSASQAEGARAVSSRGRRSRPRLLTAERSESAPGAKASRAAESERVSRSGGDAERVAEHRRISRARPPETASVSPVGRLLGRLATVTRAVGGGPERPVSKRRSGEEPTREGAFPPPYRRAGRRRPDAGRDVGLARFLRPCPEATETSRKASSQSPEGCPKGKAESKKRDRPGSGTDGAELGRREVADRRSGARGARRGGGGAVSVRPAGGEVGGPV